MKKIGVVLLVGLCVVFLAPVGAQADFPLERGINLPFWFWYPPETAIEHRFDDADFQLIHDLGFTFVRLPLALDLLYDPAAPNRLHTENLSLLDSALDDLLRYDLAVMVDVHGLFLDTETFDYSTLEADDPFLDEFEAFWRGLAAHLSTRDPERVFLELLNEPVFYEDPAAWLPIQTRLVAAVRASAPQHTIIVGGAWWSDRETLLAMKPLADPNIIYNFHFYDPFVFTHQGADWVDPPISLLQRVPYPATPQNMLPALQLVADPDAQAALIAYSTESWNAAMIETEIAAVATWAAAHGVRVICNEFGAYSLAPPLDRAQWLQDVRTALEAHQIGWAMWSYDDSFGLVLRGEDHKLFVNELVVGALGLGE